MFLFLRAFVFLFWVSCSCSSLSRFDRIHCSQICICAIHRPADRLDLLRPRIPGYFATPEACKTQHHLQQCAQCIWCGARDKQPTSKQRIQLLQKTSRRDQVQFAGVHRLEFVAISDPVICLRHRNPCSDCAPGPPGAAKGLTTQVAIEARRVGATKRSIAPPPRTLFGDRSGAKGNATARLTFWLGDRVAVDPFPPRASGDGEVNRKVFTASRRRQLLQWSRQQCALCGLHRLEFIAIPNPGMFCDPGCRQDATSLAAPQSNHRDEDKGLYVLRISLAESRKVFSVWSPASGDGQVNRKVHRLPDPSATGQAAGKRSGEAYRVPGLAATGYRITGNRIAVLPANR